jgi:hypothetical protein
MAVSDETGIGGSSILVTLSAEYNGSQLTVAVSGPSDNTIGRQAISSTDLLDGRETVPIRVTNQVQSGEYTVYLVRGSVLADANVIEQTTTTFEAPRPAVTNAEVATEPQQYRDTYTVASASVAIENQGDFPATVTHVELVTGEGQGTISAGRDTTVAAGERITLEATDAVFLPAIRTGHRTIEITIYNGQTDVFTLEKDVTVG